MSKIKIDWQKLGNIAISAAQSSAAPVFTGLGMMGLAVLCKKLNVPYQVLLDPSYSMRTVQNRPMMASGFTIMPNNSVEAAIGAILDNGKNCSDYYRHDSAKKIFDLLSESDQIADDRTRTYAIMALNHLAKSCRSAWYVNEINDIIAKIGCGEC